MARKPKPVPAAVIWDLASGGADASPVHLLFVASRCADKILANALRTSGLTPRQYAVLLTVAQSQGITRAGVASRLGLGRTSATGIVRGLMKLGLMSRDRDGPVNHSIKLTVAGQQSIYTTNPIATQVDNCIVAAVPSRRRRQFVVDLAVLVKSHRAALTDRT